MQPKQWTRTPVIDGMSTTELTSWDHFHAFVYDEMLDFQSYVWRGQRNQSWPLESTLDRQLRAVPPAQQPNMRQAHLESFKYAVRGRRGPNPSAITKEDEWWALGQHHGLATPLLDWTISPFVAAYFAFVHDDPAQAEPRAIYALWRPSIENKSSEIPKPVIGSTRSPILDFVRPMSDDNARLVNQGGLFTRAPDSTTVESWITTHFSGNTSHYNLVKITLPNAERQKCLRSLNRMNINHLTLFPDLYGASKFCNLNLSVSNY